MTTFVKQVGGEHYGGSEFQHWDMVIICKIDYLAAVATKYLARWREKGGVLDIVKAVSYVDKLTFAATISGFEPTADLDKVNQLFGQYAQITGMGPLEAEASRLLFAWRTLNDLQMAKAVLHEIIVREVVAWTPMQVLLSNIKPDAWKGFTFEGAKKDFCWFRCTACRVQFQTPIDAPPMLHHVCADDSAPTGKGYVAQ